MLPRKEGSSRVPGGLWSWLWGLGPLDSPTGVAKDMRGLHWRQYLVVVGEFLTGRDTQLHGLHSHLLRHVRVLGTGRDRQSLSPGPGPPGWPLWPKRRTGTPAAALAQPRAELREMTHLLTGSNRASWAPRPGSSLSLQKAGPGRSGPAWEMVYQAWEPEGRGLCDGGCSPSCLSGSFSAHLADGPPSTLPSSPVLASLGIPARSGG